MIPSFGSLASCLHQAARTESDCFHLSLVALSLFNSLCITLLLLMPTHYIFELYTISVLSQYSNHRSLWSFNQSSFGKPHTHARYGRSVVDRVDRRASLPPTCTSKRKKERFKCQSHGVSDVVISVDILPSAGGTEGDMTHDDRGSSHVSHF